MSAGAACQATNHTSAACSLSQDFFRNFGSILLFAVCGTLVSTAVFGGGTYLLYLTGAIAPRVFTAPLLESLIFGSLLSAVDPVATLSIFAELRATPLLYNLVFGACAPPAGPTTLRHFPPRCVCEREEERVEAVCERGREG